jgi:outer membrane protein insertion porin family
MSRLRFLPAILALVAARSLAAQDQPGGRCTTPDSISVRGNDRVTENEVRSDAGLTPGSALNFRDIQRAIRSLMATGQFDDVRIECVLFAGGTRATLTIDVKERLVLQDFRVVGVDRLSNKSVTERIELPTGRPIDPSAVARAVERIDSLYEANGYYLARIRPETTAVAGSATITFHVDEGRRLAISGIRVHGNEHIGSGQIVKALKTRPEGFWWFRKGAFDDDEWAADIGDRLPALYAKRGFIDFRVTRDTLIVNRELGKGLIDLSLNEGKQYRVGSFEVLGNKRFSTEEIRQFYPFTGEEPSLTERFSAKLRGQTLTPKDVFDQSKWDASVDRLQTAYRNEGYIYAGIRPIVERRATGDSSAPLVDLRWEVEEHSPAIINRIEIMGNDYTAETCIRDQLVIIPGGVFNQDLLIRSYQNLANMGFFETPLPTPETRQANEQGDIDVIFNLKEKRTGNVSFGASMGQGLGVGGFIGFDQPNLFGLCKRGSLNWQFGRYINDFTLSYTDPRIKQSQISGTVSAYRTLARYNIADLGRSLRTGGSLQLGFPVPHSYYSRLFVAYGGENVSFGNNGLLGESAQEFGSTSFRSSIALTFSHDTRIDMPFATAGGMQTVKAEFDGGPLGGTYSFQRYTAESRAYAPLGQIGGGKPGSQPIKFTVGLTGKAGTVFGNTGPFFFSQEFALGGVQYGEMLRGYQEFSISPTGYRTDTDQFSATRASFGKAFFTGTVEAGMRVNQAFYTNLFFEAGNVWARARDFDPTRLFRGAGIGVSTITPLGPLGLDYAYGFDRLDREGRPAPKWQLHFRLGQLF